MPNSTDLDEAVGATAVKAAGRKATLDKATKLGGVPTSEGMRSTGSAGSQARQGVAADLRGTKGDALSALGLALAGSALLRAAGSVGEGLASTATKARPAPPVRPAATRMKPPARSDKTVEHLENVFNKESRAGRGAYDRVRR